MRKPPTAEIIPVNPKADSDIITQEREYELITPLFGGGVEPGYADPVTVIRGTEIRGHLRFWWRATRGGRFGSLADLRDAESELWGAASTNKHHRPSKVQISISNVTFDGEVSPFEVVEKADRNGRAKPQTKNNDDAGPAYAAFPLQPKDEETRRIGWKSKPTVSCVRFTLKISFPKHKDAQKNDEVWKQDIEGALWAWETFGGLGARTRRGFGAIHLVSVSEDGGPKVPYVPPNPNEVQKFIADRLKRHVLPGRPHPYLPRLSASESQFKVMNSTGSPIIVWKQLIEKLRAFRQTRSDGVYGRSYWPEADEIRYRLNQYDERYADPVSNVRKFPRGIFGMPIVFHFKDQDTDDPLNPYADPIDTILKPANYERWASPLILRPLLCNGGLAVGLAIRLQSSAPPGGFVLSVKGDEAEIEEPDVYIHLEQNEADQIEPLKRAVEGEARKDVIGAFFKTL